MPSISVICFPCANQWCVRCAGCLLIFDANNNNDSVFEQKASKNKQLTRVLTQTDHNTQESLDVGMNLSPTLDNSTFQTNRLRKSVAGDTDVDAALDQHPSEVSPSMQL